MSEKLTCLDCGAVWESAPAVVVSAQAGGCLACGGRLVNKQSGREGEPEDAVTQPER